MSLNLDDTASKVMVALSRAGMPEGLSVHALAPDAHLFRDIGFTSLQIVDLALCIEEALQIDEFPLQAWADAEMELGEGGFTVQRLIDYCSLLKS